MNSNELFSNDKVNLEVLHQRAFNFRWAAVENGVIPLTAADPDFPVAEPIMNAIGEYAEKHGLSWPS